MLYNVFVLLTCTGCSGEKFCHGGAVVSGKTEAETFVLEEAMVYHLYQMAAMVFHPYLMVVTVCHSCLRVVVKAYHPYLMVVKAYHPYLMVVSAYHPYLLVVTPCHPCPKVAMDDRPYLTEAMVFHPYPTEAGGDHLCRMVAVVVCLLEEMAHHQEVEASYVVVVMAYH